MVLTLALALRVLVLVAFLTVGWGLGCLVKVLVACRVSFVCFVVAVFSARALGAGFRPGVRSTVSTTLTKGRTGRRFVVAISLRCMLVLYLLLRPSASAINKYTMNQTKNNSFLSAHHATLEYTSTVLTILCS